MSAEFKRVLAFVCFAAAAVLCICAAMSAGDESEINLFYFGIGVFFAGVALKEMPS